MKKHLIATAVAAIALPALIAAAPGSSGPGKVSIGVDASEWSSDTESAADVIPVGGDGQINGNFVTAERNGIQIGMRATDRTDGNLAPASSASGNKVGVYEAATGHDGTTTNRAEWNYDWHVDLRNAHGVAAGTSLEDYDLTLTTDIADSLFGDDVPADLTFGSAVFDDVVLYQQSWNPLFEDDFNVDDVGTYNFELTLTPTTFNGAPLTVAMQVNVSA